MGTAFLWGKAYDSFPPRGSAKRQLDLVASWLKDKGCQLSSLHLKSLAAIEYFDVVPFMKEKQRRKKTKERDKNKEQKTAKKKDKKEERKKRRKERDKERETQKREAKKG